MNFLAVFYIRKYAALSCHYRKYVAKAKISYLLYLVDVRDVICRSIFRL